MGVCGSKAKKDDKDNFKNEINKIEKEEENIEKNVVSKTGKDAVKKGNEEIKHDDVVQKRVDEKAEVIKEQTAEKDAKKKEEVNGFKILSPEEAQRKATLQEIKLLEQNGKKPDSKPPLDKPAMETELNARQKEPEISTGLPLVKAEDEANKKAEQRKRYEAAMKVIGGGLDENARILTIQEQPIVATESIKLQYK